MDWAKKLDFFDILVVGEDIEDAPQVDSPVLVAARVPADDTAKKTSAAVSRVAAHGGVSFAVLGSGETCTVTRPRRAGNEAFFQMLPYPVTDTLKEAKPQKIAVSLRALSTHRSVPELVGTSTSSTIRVLLNRLVRRPRSRQGSPTARLCPLPPRARDHTRGWGTVGRQRSGSGTHPEGHLPRRVKPGTPHRIYEPPR